MPYFPPLPVIELSVDRVAKLSSKIRSAFPLRPTRTSGQRRGLPDRQVMLNQRHPPAGVHRLLDDLHVTAYGWRPARPGSGPAPVGCVHVRVLLDAAQGLWPHFDRQDRSIR